MSLYVDFFTILSVWAPVATLLFTVPFLFAEKNYHRAILFIVALFIVTTSVVVVKTITNIPRPPGALVDALGSAFPSGHATLGFLPLGFYWTFANWPTRVVLAIYGFLVAYSRLVLGVHYLTDVVAGAAIGLFVPLLIMRYEKEIMRAWHNFKIQRTKLR